MLPILTKPAQIGENLLIDVVIDRETDFSSNVTENPVEKGFTIADHVVKKPMTLKMTAIFTPTPVTFDDKIPATTDRMGDVAKELNNIYLKAEPLTVIVPDAIYNDMVMTKAPLKRNVQNGFCYKIDLEFKHVVIVTERDEEVPEEYANNEAAGKAGTTNKDGGTASQTQVGSGMTVVGNEQAIGVATDSTDYKNAGDVSTGKEITVQTAATAFALSLVL